MPKKTPDEREARWRKELEGEPQGVVIVRTGDDPLADDPLAARSRAAKRVRLDYLTRTRPDGRGARMDILAACHRRDITPYEAAELLEERDRDRPWKLLALLCLGVLLGLIALGLSLGLPL